MAVVLTAHLVWQVGLMIEEFVLPTGCSPNAFTRFTRTMGEEARMANQQIDQNVAYE